LESRKNGWGAIHCNTPHPKREYHDRRGKRSQDAFPAQEQADGAALRALGLLLTFFSTQTFLSASREIMSGRRFVLLDRDGTLIQERHYLALVEDVELLPASGQGLRLLNQLGLGLAVLTNQSGLSRGYFDQDTLNAIHARMKQLLANEGVSLAGRYVCPHGPDDGCDCRKPNPGLVHRAAAECKFDPATCFVIGDKPCDIELGRRLGATTFLVRTGYGSFYERECPRTGYIVDDLVSAAQIIREQMMGEMLPSGRWLPSGQSESNSGNEHANGRTSQW
jgi:D-glycero-D-manno-heptose 1,7-bisphosphate phosphatase